MLYHEAPKNIYRRCGTLASNLYRRVDQNDDTSRDLSADLVTLPTRPVTTPSTQCVTTADSFLYLDNMCAFTGLYICCFTARKCRRWKTLVTPDWFRPVAHAAVTHWSGHVDLSGWKTVFVVGLVECIQWIYEQKTCEIPTDLLV